MLGIVKTLLLGHASCAYSRHVHSLHMHPYSVILSHSTWDLALLQACNLPYDQAAGLRRLLLAAANMIVSLLLCRLLRPPVWLVFSICFLLLYAQTVCSLGQGSLVLTCGHSAYYRGALIPDWGC